MSYIIGINYNNINKEVLFTPSDKITSNNIFFNKKYIVGINYININNKESTSKIEKNENIFNSIEKLKDVESKSFKIKKGGNVNLLKNPLNNINNNNLNLNKGECMLNTKICFDNNEKKKIINYLNTINANNDNSSSNQLSEQDGKINDINENNIDIIQEKFNCKNQRCIAMSLNLNLKNFKTIGPANNTNLLTNVNIDDVMEKYTLIHPNFHPIKFTMDDWFNISGNKEIVLLGNDPSYICKLINNKDQKKNCIGFIMNTDKWSGRGIHWTALFCDLRNDDEWTIEFFNSSSNKPSRNIKILIDNIINNLYTCPSKPYECIVKNINISKNEHQLSNTECGPYSLFFILNRLNKQPIKYFEFNEYDKIYDDSMVEFRKYIFWND